MDDFASAAYFLTFILCRNRGFLTYNGWSRFLFFFFNFIDMKKWCIFIRTSASTLIFFPRLQITGIPCPDAVSPMMTAPRQPHAHEGHKQHCKISIRNFMIFATSKFKFGLQHKGHYRLIGTEKWRMLKKKKQVRILQLTSQVYGKRA